MSGLAAGLWFAAQVALVDFAVARFRSDPAIKIEDAYKWLFHATQGGEHALHDSQGPRDWLRKEWEEIGPPLPDEPLIESLRPDEAVVRLNLRPYKAMGGDENALLAAFVESAQGFRSDPDSLEFAWKLLGDWARTQERSTFGFDFADWTRLDARIRPQGMPPIHHSETYSRMRSPAYRVLNGAVARRLVKDLEQRTHRQ